MLCISRNDPFSQRKPENDMLAFEIYLLNMHVSAKCVFESFTGEETFDVNHAGILN